MKLHIKLLLILLLTGFAGRVAAQSHLLTQPTDCRFAKGPVPPNARQCPACAKDKEKEKESRNQEDKKRELAKPKYASLAIDKKNGFYYGFSYDQPNRDAADNRALDECRKHGGNCTVVLAFSGEGCAAYRTISAGTAYGWGIASNRQDADAIAMRECLKRSNGAAPGNYVWACNSTTTAPLKELYNAIDELDEIPFKGPLGSTHTVAISPDGTRMATGTGNTLRLWTYPGCKLLFESKMIRNNYDRALQSVTFSPDGTLLASGESNEVKLWNVKTGKLIRIFGSHDYEVPALAFSPDGTMLASGGDFSRDVLKVWDVKTGQLIRTIKGHELGIRATSFSADNKWVATVSVDGAAKLWDIASGQTVRTFKANYEQLIDGQFSPDGRTFITIAFDGDQGLKLWDVASGSQIKTLGTLDSYGYSTNFYLGSNKAISTDMKENLILWDLASGSKLAQIGKVAYWQSAVAPDGTIVTVGAGGLEIWAVDGSSFKLLKKL